MDIENNSRASDEYTSSDKIDDKEIEITGEGAGQGDIEESQTELEKIEKREMEKKKFLDELKHETADGSERDKDKAGSHQMKYLLKQAEVFAHFVLSKNEKTKKKKPNTSKKSRSYADGDDDEDLLTHEKEELEGEESVTRLTVQPSILKGGTLKDYQLIGLNWLINLFENGVNGILADEMGLGKTIQTISLVAYLREFRKIHGPFLIIGPKSVLGNWFREFQRWLPMVKVLKLIATKAEREDILANHLKPGKFDVCLTSYEGINICKAELKKFHWKYIIIDEAHKIKNEESLISRNVREFRTHYKLLLTGTPLQNNLHELWSLLNFLLPDLFSSSAIFDQWFEMSSTAKSGDTEKMENTNMEFISQLHKILKPFLLRRTKSEVEAHLPPKKEIHLYVGLTETQVNLYKTILSKKSVNDDKKAFINILMQLRKVCNHPYLFEGVEEEGLPQLGGHLINVSGKMIILDKLMVKLRKENHQVLIFSQMTRMLDILEDYCNFRGYSYCRIDGDTDMDSRDRQICEFVEPGSNKFVFLLSTRAGGLGINLATADTVILYDSDWNPQVDLQAMDRAHRIGQKNPVNVYRLITEKSLEEKIVERQMVKLKWDTLVIQQGRFQQKNKVFTKDELKDMIQFGASEIFRSSGTITDDDIETLLERGERKTKEQNSKLNSMVDQKKNILDLAINDLNFYEFEDVNYQKKKKDDEIAINEAFIAQIENELRTRREKRLAKSYNLNEQFNNMINANKGVGAKDKKIVIKLPEFQFYEKRERLVELLTKQAEWDQAQKLKALLATVKPSNAPEENKEEQKAPEISAELEKELTENHGLTNEEKDEKEKLISTGFVEWNKDEFHNFVRGCEKFGRKDYATLSEYIGTKTPQEVQEYSKIFWARITELPEYEKHQKNIERGENQIQSRNQARELIVSKCSGYKNPKEDLDFNMVHYNKSKSKFYSLEHDKFLIYACYLEGFGNWDKVRSLIRREPMFRFDHFFKSRTESELHKRVQSLLKVLEKEKETASTTKNEEKEGKKKLKAIEEESDDDKFLIKKKSSTKKKQEEDQQQESGGSDDDDDKDKSAKKSREERYKEREMLREKATLEKYEKMKERKKSREEKKMKQTSILSFSKSTEKKNKDESPKKEEDGDNETKIEEKIEPKEEDNGSEISKASSETKVKKRRKHKEVTKGDDDIESHSLKATKVSGKEEPTEDSQ